MPRIKRGKNLNDWKSPKAKADHGKLRIVGGTYRGRQIAYSGDPVTRPMKDHTREAIFNLAGGWIEGKTVFDLFAGTGAMGLESISRGAEKAFFIERHIPTVRVIRENVQSLGTEDRSEIASADTFFWVRQFLKNSSTWPDSPWAVFCCPPYAMFQDRFDDLLTMLQSMIDVAPEDSLFVVESDDRLDTNRLPECLKWKVRQYAPALVSIAHKHSAQ
jgi:16S rRNA (guanine(966)-N(2))-methyltransferase RsmD